MLSDEERKAIERVEQFIDGERQYNTKTGETIIPYEYGESQRFVYKETYYAIQVVLNLIEKQSKEIEELEKIVETYNVMPNKYTPNNMKLVIADMEYFKDGFFKENMIPKSKIKAKIEEIKEEVKTCFIYGKAGCCTNNCKEACFYYDTIDILQRLLEEK